VTDYRSKYPRLRFSDGAKVDLDQLVPYFEQAGVEAEWRAAGVKVEWLLTPKGRLDAALRYVAPVGDNSSADTLSQE
jgi:hypothetical protein